MKVSYFVDSNDGKSKTKVKVDLKLNAPYKAIYINIEHEETRKFIGDITKWVCHELALSLKCLSVQRIIE